MGTTRGTHARQHGSRKGRSALTSEIVAGVKRSDEASIRIAFEELDFILAPIAEADALPGHDVSELVTSFLDDFLLDIPHLAFDERGIVGYAVRSFRNFLKQTFRNDHVRNTRHDAAAARVNSPESIVGECHSEYSLTASNQESDENVPSALDALSRHLSAGLSETDKQLLRTLARGATVKEASERCGLDYGACRVRIHRLRVRMRVEALAYAEHAQPADAAYFGRFMRRLGSGGDVARRTANAK